jgi:integrase/recombinase XerD
VELLELWRRHLEKTKSERTTITYLNAIKSFLKKLQLPSHKLVDVSSADLYQYADSSELSSTSLLTHFSALRHFYRFLARRGYLQRNNTQKLKKP